jgi:hypothetical protein
MHCSRLVAYTEVIRKRADSLQNGQRTKSTFTNLIGIYGSHRMHNRYRQGSGGFFLAIGVSDSPRAEREARDKRR